MIFFSAFIYIWLDILLADLRIVKNYELVLMNSMSIQAKFLASRNNA